MSPDFESRLRQQLMNAKVPPHRSPRRWLAATAAAIAGLIIGIVTILSPTPASADVEITRSDGRVTVRLTDLTGTPQEVQEALDAAGVDVRVDGVPVGPSNIGRFVGDTATDENIQDVHHVDENGPTFMGFSIPEDWTGTLTVLLGRKAQPTQTYALFSDAYAPGEPLACTNTLGQTLTEAATILDDYTVTIRGPLGSSTPPTPLAEALENDPDLRIESAYAISPTELLVTASPDPVTEAEPPC